MHLECMDEMEEEDKMVNKYRMLTKPQVLSLYWITEP